MIADDDLFQAQPEAFKVDQSRVVTQTVANDLGQLLDRVNSDASISSEQAAHDLHFSLEGYRTVVLPKLRELEVARLEESAYDIQRLHDENERLRQELNESNTDNCEIWVPNPPVPHLETRMPSSSSQQLDEPRDDIH